MFLAFYIILNVIILTVGNPFHKYPFVFLLDVGNEELEKANTEQIRISVPGGSLALRYPAIGNGDTIAHVRVSGIDFGTDLKANILDGGPGYKYVVLVFMGNPGVPYDAVLTVQSLKCDNINDIDTQVTELSENTDGYKVSESVEDNDNSDEVMDRPQEQAYEVAQKNNPDIVQSEASSSNYVYEKNEDLASEDVDNGDGEETDSEENNNEEDDSDSKGKLNHDDSQYDGEQSDTGVESDQNIDNAIDNPKAAPYSVNNQYNLDDDIDGESVGVVDNNLYGKYEVLKPHLYDGVKIYPQKTEGDQIESSRGEFEEDPVEIDQMFNDEEVHNDADKFKDNNNNDYDQDEVSAVAY